MHATRVAAILTVALWAVVAPVEGSAQQEGRVYRVGYLTPWEARFEKEGMQIFEEVLRQKGHVPAKNVLIIYRSANGRDDALPKLAAELLQLNVDVIVAAGTPATRAAQQTTATTPIVMLTVLDPVRAGFVATLSHPGGNITGSSELSEELIPKRLELIRETIPHARLVAVLWDPAHPTNALDLDRAKAAALKLGMKVNAVAAHDRAEIEKALAQMKRGHPDAVLILTSPAFTGQLSRIVELARKYRLPAFLGTRSGATAGGLMSYGPDIADQYRNAAMLVEKILDGAKPAELPVEQPKRFELVINARTAKMLGLTIPQPVLLRADEVVNCWMKNPTSIGGCPKSADETSEP
jgi:putative ABC transport system substrate-binding protein